MVMVCLIDLHASMWFGDFSRPDGVAGHIPQCRLISVEDVRNYLSHIIYIFIFDFFLNFLLFVRLQTPTSSPRCWKEV